jgi:hypothetical protein
MYFRGLPINPTGTRNAILDSNNNGTEQMISGITRVELDLLLKVLFRYTQTKYHFPT